MIRSRGNKQIPRIRVRSVRVSCFQIKKAQHTHARAFLPNFMYWNVLAIFHFSCCIRLGNAELKLRIHIKSESNIDVLYFGLIYTHEDSLKFLDDSNNEKYEFPWAPMHAAGLIIGCTQTIKRRERCPSYEVSVLIHFISNIMTVEFIFVSPCGLCVCVVLFRFESRKHGQIGHGSSESACSHAILS